MRQATTIPMRPMPIRGLASIRMARPDVRMVQRAIVPLLTDAGPPPMRVPGLVMDREYMVSRATVLPKGIVGKAASVSVFVPGTHWG